MKMICSMYKAAPGTTGVSNTGFEERAYKLSLVRINREPAYSPPPFLALPGFSSFPLS